MTTKYMICVGGGVGPGVWDKVITLEVLPGGLAGAVRFLEVSGITVLKIKKVAK